MINITSPRFPQDIKIIKEGSGELNPGAAGYIEVANFDIPVLVVGGIPDPLMKFRKIIIYIDLIRIIGAENGGINTSVVSGDGAGTKPCNVAAAGAHLWVRCEIFPSYLDAIPIYTINYIQTTNTTQTMITDNASWGDVSLPQKIYINLQRRAATQFYYTYQVYMVGDEVQ